MTAEYYSLQVLLLTVSGWVNREQQLTIEYLVASPSGNIARASGCSGIPQGTRPSYGRA